MAEVFMMGVMELYHESENILTSAQSMTEQSKRLTTHRIDEFEQILTRYKRCFEQASANLVQAKKTIEGAQHVSRDIPQPSVSRPVLTPVVERFVDVPNIQMYWVSGANMYAIRINDVLICGNIGKIGEGVVRTRMCRDGNTCSRENCTFYHDPIETPWSTDVMNYRPSAWMVSDELSNSKSRDMRHVGSYPLIERHAISNEEKIIRRNQLMHDMITVLLLHQVSSGAKGAVAT
jgi:hypothetical protein